MTGYSYQIIIPVSFDYKDEYWQKKFACISPAESVLSLKFKERTADRYEVESLTGELGGKAFCVSQSILSINDDFTKGTIFGSSKDYNGIYGCSMVALYGNLIRRNTIVMHSSLIDATATEFCLQGRRGPARQHRQSFGRNTAVRKSSTVTWFLFTGIVTEVSMPTVRRGTVRRNTA